MLARMLLYDRVSNMEWMVEDEGIVEQMVPMLFEEGQWMEVPLKGEEGKPAGEWMIELSGECWREFFEAEREPKQRKAFMQKHLIRGKKKKMEEAKREEEKRVEDVKMGEEDKKMEENAGKLQMGKMMEEEDKEEGDEAQREEWGMDDEEAIWAKFSDWMRIKVMKPTLARKLLERVGGQMNIENPTNEQSKVNLRN